MGRIETVPTKKTRSVTITFNHTFIITFIKEVQEPSTITRTSVFKSHLNPLIALNNNCKHYLKSLGKFSELCVFKMKLRTLFVTCLLLWSLMLLSLFIIFNHRLLDAMTVNSKIIHILVLLTSNAPLSLCSIFLYRSKLFRETKGG